MNLSRLIKLTQHFPTLMTVFVDSFSVEGDRLLDDVDCCVEEAVPIMVYLLLKFSVIILKN